MDTSRHTNIAVRVRAIILVEGKLLCVRHTEANKHIALPGGHLEFGEDIYAALTRELVEELGVMPVLGRLLFVYNWNDGVRQNIEFFIEIINTEDYKDPLVLKGECSFEIAEIVYADDDTIDQLLPQELITFYKHGELLNDMTRSLYTS